MCALALLIRHLPHSVKSITKIDIFSRLDAQIIKSFTLRDKQFYNFELLFKIPNNDNNSLFNLLLMNFSD